MARYEMRLSGSGGQGIILAGIILAEAAICEEGLYVTQTQSYGPESRGGASRAEVVISRKEIAYPKVILPDILVSLTQEAFNKYGAELKDEAVVIIDEGIDTSKLSKDKEQNVYLLPILKTAEERVGLKLTANIVTLGVVAEFVKQIREDFIIKAIEKRVPFHTLDLNLKAFNLGRELVNYHD